MIFFACTSDREVSLQTFLSSPGTGWSLHQMRNVLLLGMLWVYSDKCLGGSALYVFYQITMFLYGVFLLRALRGHRVWQGYSPGMHWKEGVNFADFFEVKTVESFEEERV